MLLELHRALAALQAGALGPMTRALDRCESMCRDLDAELPDEVVAGTRARYVEAYEKLTGIPFAL